MAKNTCKGKFMNKRLQLEELDIPTDDLDCWTRYPKHRWVYDLSRVLDSQGIFWSPINLPGLIKLANLVLETDQQLPADQGNIYIEEPSGTHRHTDVYITKGSIKLLKFTDAETGQELTEIDGELEIKINAFISMHFTKYTGVVSLETYRNQIFRVQLRPRSHLSEKSNIDIVKISKKIFKRANQEVTV
jgi:hypothetical protein